MKSKLVAGWLALVVACSLVARFDDGWLASYLSLQPRKILHGELWRLVTWPLIELWLLSAILAVRAIQQLGGDLAASWGNAWLARYVLAITVAGGVAYTLAAYATGDATLWRCGGNATAYALAVAWSRAYPQNILLYWRMISLRGLGVVAGVCVLALLKVAAGGFVEALPELTACALAIVWPQRTTT